jgi:hypothetical protein
MTTKSIGKHIYLGLVTEEEGWVCTLGVAYECDWLVVKEIFIYEER